MIEQKAALERLHPSERADHKTVLKEQGLRREVCTDGTRVKDQGLKVLDDITKWANDCSLASPCVFWLTGRAGSGKTTIAYTIAKRFEGDNANQHTIMGGRLAAFSAHDNSKKHNLILESFLPLPTNLPTNANHMQIPYILPTNLMQSITTSPAR